MILKFINGKNDSNEQLKSVIDYVTDEKKTEPSLIGGYCCDTKYPYEDMSVLKKLHNKDGGKQYEHYVIAFDPEDDIDNETAFRVASDVVHNYKKHQSIWAVHTNTDHVHVHVIMNSVSSDGEKFSQWKPKLNSFKSYVDNTICKKYSINPIKKCFGSKPVDDINRLEFETNEFKEVYGGNSMKKYFENNNNSYEDDFQYLDDGYNDGCLTVYEEAAETNSTKPELCLGNEYIINVNDTSELSGLISSLNIGTKYTPQKVKEIMTYFGSNVKYCIGDRFKINLVNQNNDTINDKSENEIIDAEFDSINKSKNDNPFNFHF